MRNSLFLKILKVYLVVVIVFTILLFVFFKNTVKNLYINTLISKFKDLNTLISYSISPKVLRDTKEVSKLVSQFAEKFKLRITIISSDGNILADSHQEPKFIDVYTTQPEIIQAIKEGVGSSVRYDPTLKEEMIYVATFVKKDNVSFIVRTSHHLKDVKIATRQLLIKVLQVLVVLILIVTALSFSISYSTTKLLKQLAEATKKLSEGNFDTELPTTTQYEFKALVENFNLMVTKLKNLLQEISTQKDRVNNIFNSIQEAVVLLSKDGKILLYNEKFEKLCKTSPNGRNYLEVLVSSEFNESVKQAIEENRNLLKEINIADQTYLCSLSFISENELVVLLYNITEHKQLQSIKKELVANIAHELKTPLTSIKGFAETLENELKDPQHKHYLEIILSNTERLINIVNDLTTLSQLEDKTFKLEIEEVNLLDLADTIKKLFQNKIEQKGLKLIIELQKDLKPIKADRFRLEQVLINLVDNALRYTEEGYVKLEITQDTHKTYILVEDTGVGIPKEYHQRIFERFFVVDKARSRQTGGTGLGLSIVKHIVELHKGEISLESQLGKGTKFKVVLNNDVSS